MNTQKADTYLYNSDDTQGLSYIRSIHSQFPLCGVPRNAMLNFSDEILLYIISLLKNKAPPPPKISISQWFDIISILNSHWILPILYWQISHNLPENSKPPKEIVDALRITFLENKARSIKIEKQISELVDNFNKERVRIIVLKGAALARTVYPDPALRSGSDIDLLVLPEDVCHSRMIMEKLGYECVRKYFDMSKNWFCDEEFEYKGNAKDYLQVEIHWSLNEYTMLRSMHEDQFFDRAVKIKTPGLSFEALHPIDNIIHSVTHLGLKHNSDIRLSWIYDIYLLCKDLSPEDWGVLQQRSIEYGARISLEKFLIITQYWTGLQIPLEFSDFSKWPAPTQNEVKAFLYATEGLHNPVCQFKLRWPGSAPPGEKIRILTLFIFPPIEDMKYQYNFKNDWLVILYYIKRWFLLIKKGYDL